MEAYKIALIATFGGLTALLLLYCLISTLLKRRRFRYWQEIAKRKRLERDQLIANEKLPPNNISDKLKEEILNSDVTTLRRLLDEGKVTSKQILLTYYERVRTIGLENEWITDTNFQEAYKQAEECDRLASEGKATKGPFFGIPISVKDFLGQKGFDSTFGLANKCFAPLSEDCLALRILRDSGAIPFVRSNVPQASLHVESLNFIWGNAKNPYSKTRTTGGSSGGESGLVGGRCSPLGLGTDTVGSLRMPPVWCGVLGFRSTPGRVSLKGHAVINNRLTGNKHISHSVGGIAKSVDDLDLMMKVLVTEKQREYGPIIGDVTVVNAQWNEREAQCNGRKFRIGYVKSFDLFHATDASIRAVEESVTALKKRGHEVIEVQVPDFEKIVSTTYGILLAEGDAKSLKEALKGERPLPSYEVLLGITNLPRFMRSFIAKLMGCLGEKFTSMMVKHLNGKTASEMMMLGYDKEELFKKFLKMWSDNQLDALVLPCTPTPAPKLNIAKDLANVAYYCMIDGLFAMPGGALPITTVKKEEMHYTKQALSKRQLHEKVLGKSMEDSAGLPVGVQVTALPFQDEKIIAVMREIEQEVNFRARHPYPL